MWLPSDERRVLSGYYELISEIEQERVYRETDLTELLTPRPRIHSIPEYGNSPEEPASSETMGDMEGFENEVKHTCDRLARIRVANKLLVTRKLITLREHEHVHGVVLVGLTVDGCDLGRRYRSFLDRSGLWFAAYRHHWVWLILSFLGGILGSALIQWLTES